MSTEPVTPVTPVPRRPSPVVRPVIFRRVEAVQEGLSHSGWVATGIMGHATIRIWARAGMTLERHRSRGGSRDRRWHPGCGGSRRGQHRWLTAIAVVGEQRSTR
jgi:hypothetical protein